MIKSIGAGPGEPMDTIDRPWARETLAVTDGRRAIALMAEHGTEIYRRTAPLYPAIVAAASTDPDVADAYRTVLQMKRSGIRRQVEVIAGLGHLRPGLSVERAADLIYSISSIEMYRPRGRLRVERGRPEGLGLPDAGARTSPRGPRRGPRRPAHPRGDLLCSIAACGDRGRGGTMTHHPRAGRPRRSLRPLKRQSPFRPNMETGWPLDTEPLVLKELLEERAEK